MALGFAPHDLNVILSRGSGFSAGIVSAGTAWPDGTAVELVFYAHKGVDPIERWAAQVSGLDIGWSVPAADVDDLVDAGAASVRLFYTAAEASPMLWARGQVRVY